MAHEETRRRMPQAKNGVLFLHGIVGSPDHFRLLIPLEASVPADWSVYNLLFPGHGGTVEDFGRSRMCQWRSHAREAFLELAEEHEKVLLVGHSMGTLFAMQLAVAFPEKVAGIFLLNVPLRPMPRLFFIQNCLRLTFGSIRENRPREACFQKACGVTPTPFVWRYLRWIPGIFELFGEICRTEKLIGRLTVPAVVWQSRKDDLVSNFSAAVLRKRGAGAVHELPDSTHFYYTPGDRDRVCLEFDNWIKKISG